MTEWTDASSQVYRAKKVNKEPSSKLYFDEAAVKQLKLVVVAYSHVERDQFQTKEAYEAEIEVVDRAHKVVSELQAMGINAKGYPADQYFMTNLLVDKPDVVLNLVDTLKGSDLLQTSIPAALELANIPYTGCGLQGLVVGNDRQLTKKMLETYKLPTPKYQFIEKAGTKIRQDLGLPLIVKLNESGGSVGINDKAVQETIAGAESRASELIETYKIPVLVEKFIDGQEINAIVFDDRKIQHVFLAEKVFKGKVDGKHSFQSIDHYDEDDFFHYEKVQNPLAKTLTKICRKAFNSLNHKDYAKFDIRVEEKTGKPFITDSNPNTALGPDNGYPFADVLKFNGVLFREALLSLLTPYAKHVE
jgi:D-alanine-D-alanine ligase